MNTRKYVGNRLFFGVGALRLVGALMAVTFSLALLSVSSTPPPVAAECPAEAENCVSPGHSSNGGRVTGIRTPPIEMCHDGAASNPGQVGTCIYVGPSNAVSSDGACTDVRAMNFGATGVCLFSGTGIGKLCLDVNSSNFLGALPCTYPSISGTAPGPGCQNLAALTPMQLLACVVPAYKSLCLDAGGLNFMELGPCIFPSP